MDFGQGLSNGVKPTGKTQNYHEQALVQNEWRTVVDLSAPYYISSCRITAGSAGSGINTVQVEGRFTIDGVEWPVETLTTSNSARTTYFISELPALVKSVKLEVRSSMPQTYINRATASISLTPVEDF